MSWASCIGGGGARAYVIGPRAGRAKGMPESEGKAEGQNQDKGCMMLSYIHGWP